MYKLIIQWISINDYTCELTTTPTLQNNSVIPKTFPITLCHLSLPPLPAPVNYQSAFCHYRLFAFSRIFIYTESYSIYSFLSVFFHLNDAFQIHPCWCIYKCFVPFLLLHISLYNYTIFSLFFYLFMEIWIFSLQNCNILMLLLLIVF